MSCYVYLNHTQEVVADTVMAIATKQTNKLRLNIDQAKNKD